MIALVAAGREGGGDGGPVFHTVPWSPSIAERGELPGSIIQGLLELRALLLADRGDLETFARMTLPEVFMLVLTIPGYGYADALGVALARNVMAELGMLG
jgi:hypothetical protein